MMKGRILVVDDERQARDALEMLLTEDGWTVVPAASGRTAIETLALGPVDAVVTDLVMPDIDGLTLLEWIEHNRPATPVLVVSGHADVAKRTAIGWRAGLQYLPKPVRYQDITEWLAKAA